MNSAFLALQRYLSALPLSEAAIADIQACFNVKTYARGQYFAMSGEVDGRLGFVVDGLFAMQVEKPGETIFVKDFLTSGDFLLAAFEPEAENVVHIQAIHESRILEARYSDILALSTRYPDFKSLSERGMQRRYQDICDRLEQMAMLDAGGRYEIFQNAFGDLEDAIPQYLVAAYVGVTPTQLSRIRNKPKSG